MGRGNARKGGPGTWSMHQNYVCIIYIYVYIYILFIIYIYRYIFFCWKMVQARWFKQYVPLISYWYMLLPAYNYRLALPHFCVLVHESITCC